MNIGKLTATAALAIGLGTASAMAASVPALEPSDGLSDIGIDISTAGSSPESVGQFLGGLAPETQRLVLSGCETAVNSPVSYKPEVVTFCQNAIGGAAAPFDAPAMGFMPDEPAIAPDAMSGVGAY